jgi:hypothetical protein
MPRCNCCDSIVSYDAHRGPQCGELDPWESTASTCNPLCFPLATARDVAGSEGAEPYADPELKRGVSGYLRAHC